MLIDHTGMILFPDAVILRIIGRLSFPIFAYLIFEGCRYTRNKLRYLLVMLGLGILTSAVYYVAEDRLFGNVLITFSCSIVLCYCLQAAAKANGWVRRGLWMLLTLGLAVGLWRLCYVIRIDYGILGILLPVVPTAVSVLCQPKKRLAIFTPHFLGFAAALGIQSCIHGGKQAFAMLALLPLAFYNGERGFRIPKYAFYAFYPIHLALLWLIERWIAFS